MSSLFITLTAPNGLSYSQPTGLFINNEFVEAQSKAQLSTINPATEQEITKVSAAGPEDVDIAVKAARKAFKHPSWRKLPGTSRGELLLKLASLVEENSHTLATIETWDNGKWNFPLAMAAWKLGPALACGNTIVMKPAEQTPLSILFLATLIVKAGFPPGVVNILNGYGRTAGAALASHPQIDKIAFTGSTQTGREIMKMAAVNLKNITLETGGKSPLLVFEDANLESAIQWAHTGIMFNQGQICTATSRILVHESVYDQFVGAFKKHTKNVSKIGDPFKNTTFQGPQITKAQFDRVMSYIEAGKTEGATLVYGGEAYKDVNGRGFFVSPTIFTNVTDGMSIYREEVFGPFVVISSFKTEEEAVTRANDTTYGLGAAVFTQDIKRAHRVAADIEAGMVWINSSNDSDFRIPFGGVKQSGIGRELGEAGLAAYTNIKSVHVNLD
ncbi:hypothetical protein B7463_g7914, partial [Scytalidium lignicola]